MNKILFLIVMALTSVTSFAQENAANFDTTFATKAESNSDASYWFWRIGAIILVLAILSFIQQKWKKR